MNRYFFITFAFLPVFVMAGVIVLWAFGGKEKEPAPKDGLDKEFALYLEVRQMLLDHYDGELKEQTLADEALVGMAAGTGDRYTRVNPPVEAKSQDIDLQGTFYGINCVIEENEDGSIRITQVQAGGGGEQAGLLNDDVIVAVDGTSTLGQTFESTRLRIQSSVKGSVVKIGVLRGGDPKKGNDAKGKRLEFDVTRSEVVQYSVHDVHMETRDGRKFGYLHISDFNANTYDPQCKEAILELMELGAEGLVIDIRGNGGGRVPPAVDLVDALLKEKDALVVFTRSSRESNRKDDHVYKTRDETSLTDLPVVLLVDGGTASASEIFAGAVKDYGRAYLVGERTYGKGIVQTIFRLETDPQYSMNITTTQYFTPLGRRMQKGDKGEPGGIAPDLEVRYRQGEQQSVRNRMTVRRARFNREQIAESSKWWNQEDRMLEAGLNVLAGKPVNVKD